MEPRTLNGIALAAMTAAGLFWIAFQFTGQFIVILLGAAIWAVGFIFFIAYIVAMIEQHLADWQPAQPVSG